MAGGKTSAFKVKRAERRALAVELRKAGLSYREIAARMRQMGVVGPRYTHSTAYKDVRYELDRVLANSAEDASEVRALELARLDEMWARLWPQVVQEEEPLKLGVVDRLLRIQERRARLLGLDAPLGYDLTTAGMPVLPVVVYEGLDDSGYRELDMQREEKTGGDAA